MYNFEDDPTLSASWKAVFARFERYGIYGVKDPAGYRALPLMQRMDMNFLAFVFGPIYYVFKGMYRIALSFFLIIVGIILVLTFLDILIGFEISRFWTGGVSGVLYSLAANYAYYNYKVKGYRGWNPYHGISGK